MPIRSIPVMIPVLVLVGAFVIVSPTVLGQEDLAAQSTEGSLDKEVTAARHAAESGDLASLVKSVQRILDLCQSDQFRPVDPARIDAMVFAGRINYALGQQTQQSGYLQQAFATFESVRRDAAIGSAQQIHSRAFLLKRDIGLTSRYVADAIGLLVDLARYEIADELVLHECQDFAYDAFVYHLTGVTFRRDLALAKMHALEQRLIDAAVPVGIARLTRLAYCELLIRKGSGYDLGESLRESRQILVESRNLIQDATVSVQRRALYWNLAAEVSLKLGLHLDALESCRQFQSVAPSDGIRLIAKIQEAHVALRLGDYDYARKLLEEAGKQFEPLLSGNQVAGNQVRLPPYLVMNITEWLVNLAKALEGSDDFGEANRLLKLAQQLLEPHSGQLPIQVSLVSNNLGLNHYLQGEFDRAEDLMGQSRQTIGQLAARGRRFPGLGEQIGESTVNAGWIALGRREFEQAEQHFADASTYFLEQFGTQHPRYAETLTYRARVAALQGRHDQAAKWLHEAEALVFERICRNLANTDSSRDRIAMIQEARVHPESIAWPGTIDTYLELALELEIPAREQYEVVLRWKGLLQRFEAKQPEKSSSELELELNQKLRNTYFRKVSFSQRRRNEAEILAYENQLRELRQSRRRDLQVEPELLSVDARTVSEQLQADELLLDIYQIRTFRQPTPQAASIGSVQQYLGFVVYSDGRVERVVLGTADQVDEAINKLRSDILEAQYSAVDSQDKDGVQDRQERRVQIQQSGERLSRMLLDAVHKAGPAYRHLTICPDAQSHLVPWAALPASSRNAYLIEDKRLLILRTADSHADYQPARPVAAGDESLLVVGDVSFASAEPLAGTAREKTKVKQVFRATRSQGQIVDLGKSEATEMAVLNAIEGKSWIHLATHGYFQGRGRSQVFEVTGATTLLQTGLLLAPAGDKDAGRDEYLTAAEIRELDLSTTNLVVLSACESGLGKSTAGQGVQGLLDCFHEAGATFVVGTLWKVDDVATEILVERFYHHLWRSGLAPADALRAAQLDLLHTSANDPSAKILKDPYAWAAFFCSSR